jgi:DNA-binding GntR family transcriptional regulator
MPRQSKSTAPALRTARAEKAENLKDRACITIREAILSHELTPGTQLSEASLAEQLGMSRTPIREALKTLEEEGLVEVVPRQGAFVTDISAKDIVEIYQLREALECYAVQFVPTYGDAAELDELIADFELSPKWIKDNEIEKINEADVRLHRYIAHSSQNQMLIKLVDQLLGQIIRLRLMTPSVPGRLASQAQEHMRMVHALKAGDVEEARRELRDHLQNVRATFLRMHLGLETADEKMLGGNETG